MIDDNSFNNFNFYLNGIVNEKVLINEIIERKDKLEKKIKDISWKDLVVEFSHNNGNIDCYEVDFQEDILQEITEIKSIYENFQHLEDVGHEILFQGDHLSTDITIQICQLNNRIDMTGDGIPRAFRNLGLGCKIYRAILEKVDYISSEDHNLSSHGKLLWNSLRKNEMFYTFYHQTRAFCFASDKDPNVIIRILEENINPDYINQILWDIDFVEKHRSLIQKSRLADLL